MFTAVGLVMLGNYYGYDSIGPVAEQLSRELHFSDTQNRHAERDLQPANIFLTVIAGAGWIA